MKDFDIYLRKRLTECDIIVYSIPYRDGLTVVDRLILECCLENYLLQKMIAARTGSELIAHIDEMLKTVYERLNGGVELGVTAEFSTHYTAYPQKAAIEIGAEQVKLLATTFEQAMSNLQIAVAPLDALVGKSLGRGSSTIEMEQSIRATLKNSIEKFSDGLMVSASVSEDHKQDFEKYTEKLNLMADLVNLCYRFYNGGSTVMEVVAAVKEIEIHYSLGGGESAIVIDSSVTDGDYATKIERVSNALLVLVEVTESITQFMAPTEASIVIGANAGSILRRFRLLKEVDDLGTLMDIDDFMLDDLDYVILEE